MPDSRVVDERVLAPISEQRPAGEDLRGFKDWVEIRKARPNPNDIPDKREWEPATPVRSDWSTYKNLVEKALCTKSKDLELGVFLTEACARVHGFAGIRDGIWTVKGLLAGFSERGLYPLPEDGNLESRYGKLEWMNEKLAEVMKKTLLSRNSKRVWRSDMALSREGLVAKLNATCREALEEAARLCFSRTHYEVDLEHYLSKLSDVSNSDVAAIYRHFEIDSSHILRDLTRSLDRMS